MQMLSPQMGSINNGPDNLNPMSRVLSPTSIEGTPRSSGDFYSASNNSSDTQASEYVNQGLGQNIGRPSNTRHPSFLVPLKPDNSPEILMMGYGHISGFFTFDGSLVNQSPFHEVRRKGIIGGQGGGGVVRAEPAKRDSGLFGSLSWGNIGESLGGFLGSHEMSSISHAKETNSKLSIPIVSTPQSLLFVDLRLEPGQSRSYSYGHRLPRGIPPTYRGRAIKISYNLVIGVQKVAQLTPQPQLQQFEIPFRVLPGVNSKRSHTSRSILLMLFRLRRRCGA